MIDNVVILLIPILLSVIGFFIRSKLNSICKTQSEIKKDLRRHVVSIHTHCPVYQHAISRRLPE